MWGVQLTLIIVIVVVIITVTIVVIIIISQNFLHVRQFCIMALKALFPSKFTTRKSLSGKITFKMPRN